MAKILNGHFGSFTGKIGAVTGRKRKGIYYISQSITHNGSNTKKQAEQRKVFTALSKAIAPFAAAVALGFKNTRPGMTSLNEAMSFNSSKMNRETFSIRPQDIVIARGNLDNVAASLDNPDDGVIKFVWNDNSETSFNATKEDMVIGVLFNAAENRAVMAQATRVDGGITMGFPGSWTGVSAHGYVFCVGAKGLISDSAYIGTVNCN